MLPRILIEGNLAKDPELRFTQGGKAMTTFTVVASDSRRNEAGQWEDVDTTFFDVICWGQIAENVANSLAKGSGAVVYGKIHQRSWENEQGETRRSWQVRADNVGPSLRFAEAQTKKVERTQQVQDQNQWSGAPKAAPGSADPWAAFGGGEQSEEPPF